MPDFTMQHYWNQYQDAVTKADRLRQRIEGLKTALACGAGGEEMLEELQTAEEEYKAAQAKADDLYYLSHYGKSREELQQGRVIRNVPRFGGTKPRTEERFHGFTLPKW